MTIYGEDRVKEKTDSVADIYPVGRHVTTPVPVVILLQNTREQVSVNTGRGRQRTQTTDQSKNI